MCNDHGYSFIATLHNVLLATELCDLLILIIKSMNSGRTYLLHQWFYTVYFIANKKKVTLLHSAQRKHAFWGEIKEMSKTNNLPAKKKFALELLHHKLGHRSTRLLLAGDTDNVWEDIQLIPDTDPFCTSCQISSINKKARPKILLTPKAPFKWVFKDIVLSTAPKSSTNDTTFSNYILIVDAYSKITKKIGMEKVTTEEVTENLHSQQLPTFPT